MASQVFSTSRAGTRGAPKGMELKSRDGEPFPAVLPAARQGAAPHREIPIPIANSNPNSQLPIPNSQAGIELINKGNSGSGLHHPTDQYTQKERGDSNALHPADLTEINRSAKDSFNSPSRIHRLEQNPGSSHGQSSAPPPALWTGRSWHSIPRESWISGSVPGQAG